MSEEAEEEEEEEAYGDDDDHEDDDDDVPRKKEIPMCLFPPMCFAKGSREKHRRELSTSVRQDCSLFELSKAKLLLLLLCVPRDRRQCDATQRAAD
jgi:hypothetical protein